MKRLLSSTFAAAGLCAALAAQGCGSDAGGGTTAAADTATTTDAAVGVGDAAPKPDTSTADTGPAGADAAPDVAPADVKQPCGGACKPTEMCDAATDKCVEKPKTNCEPACKPGAEYCDFAAKPPVCKAQTCKFQDKWGPDIQGASKLQVAAKTIGCDLDGDSLPNNALATALSAFMGQINGSLDKGIKDGSFSIDLETAAFKADGSEFAMNLVVGDLDPSNATCDISSGAKCKYTVSPNSYDVKATAAVCPALINFPNCKIKDGKLSGGGKNQLFLFTLPIPNLSLVLKISQATIQGDVTATKGWDSTKKGLICGVLGKQDIVDAINAIPDEQIAKFGIGDKKTIIGMVTGLLKSDIDGDGDGVKESASVALEWESVPVEILGMTPPPK